MSDDFCVEFVPGGRVEIGGPAGIYAVPGASNVEDARKSAAGPVAQNATAAPAVRQLRTVGRTTAPTSQDPATCIADRISALQLEMATIDIEIARRAGIKAELKQLRKALEAFRST